MMVDVAPVVDIVIMATGGAMGSLIVYIAIQVRQIYNSQQLHNRMIFGEDGVEGWEGLLRICLDNRKYIAQVIDILDDLIDTLARSDSLTVDLQLLKDKLQEIKNP